MEDSTTIRYRWEFGGPWKCAIEVTCLRAKLRKDLMPINIGLVFMSLAIVKEERYWNGMDSWSPEESIIILPGSIKISGKICWFRLMTKYLLRKILINTQDFFVMTENFLVYFVALAMHLIVKIYVIYLITCKWSVLFIK